VTGFPQHPPTHLTCSVRAFGVVEATPQTLSVLRKQPGPPGGPVPPASLLNHADDQTVAALAAVLNAIQMGRFQPDEFTDWAVVAAPRFAGRVAVAGSLEKYRRLGPLSVSPILIPFISLHSPSSLISLALRIHGPSFGVGGGSGEFVQALLTGLALQQQRDVPGVWVVVAGWDPEMVPEPERVEGQRPVCRAAALALLPEAAGAQGSHMRLVPVVETETEPSNVPSLPSLVRFLGGAETSNPTRRWSCPVNGGYKLELTVREGGLLAKSA
jgi:hypothetical protein